MMGYQVWTRGGSGFSDILIPLGRAALLPLM